MPAFVDRWHETAPARRLSARADHRPSGSADSSASPGSKSRPLRTGTCKAWKYSESTTRQPVQSRSHRSRAIPSSSVVATPWGSSPLSREHPGGPSLRRVCGPHAPCPAGGSRPPAPRPQRRLDPHDSLRVRSVRAVPPRPPPSSASVIPRTDSRRRETARTPASWPQPRSARTPERGRRPSPPSSGGAPPAGSPPIPSRSVRGNCGSVGLPSGPGRVRPLPGTPARRVRRSSRPAGFRRLPTIFANRARPSAPRHPHRSS